MRQQNSFNPVIYCCKRYEYALENFSCGLWTFSYLLCFQDHFIVVEEELLLAPDYLSFLAECLSILNSDPTLLGVSAWNFNGNYCIPSIGKPFVLVTQITDFILGKMSTILMAVLVYCKFFMFA